MSEYEYWAAWKNSDGSLSVAGDGFDSDDWGDGSLESAEEAYAEEVRNGISNVVIVRRRKAGEWEEIPNE